MADFDHCAFARDVRAALDERGQSFAQACAAHGGLDKAMLSRAVHEQKLSAANVLLLCRAFALDPFVYLVERPRLTLKSIAKQAVTHSVQRETQETRP